MNKEIWKNIPGYNGLYQASTLGNIRSMNYKNTGSIKLLSKCKDPFGYNKVCIKGKSRKVSRLVAITFIPNPENKKTVNHINHNKQDDRVENLEWNTYSEQYDKIVKSYFQKSCLQYDKEGNFIREWDCISDAARFVNGKPASIGGCCMKKKHYNTAYGYIWKYKL